MVNFSVLPKADIHSNTLSRQRRAVFRSFLSENIKQDSETTTAHSNHLISFLKDKKLLTTSLGKIWGNSDGCAKQYRCASELYLMSVMSHCYSIIIYRGISAPGHGKEVVDGLNTVDKRHIYQLMSTVQLPVSKIFYSQMQIHTGYQKDDVSLAKEFQRHLTKYHHKNGAFDQVK